MFFTLCIGSFPASFPTFFLYLLNHFSCVCQSSWLQTTESILATLKGKGKCQIVLGNSQNLQQDQRYELGGDTARNDTYILGVRTSGNVSFWLPPLGEETLKSENFPNLGSVCRCAAKSIRNCTLNFLILLRRHHCHYNSPTPVTPTHSRGLLLFSHRTCVCSYDDTWSSLVTSSPVIEGFLSSFTRSCSSLYLNCSSPPSTTHLPFHLVQSDLFFMTHLQKNILRKANADFYPKLRTVRVCPCGCN